MMGYNGKAHLDLEIVIILKFDFLLLDRCVPSFQFLSFDEFFT